MKIRAYLEYKWEQRKKIKLEEGELFQLLNENLGKEIMIFMNARILKKINSFVHFDIEFLSQMTISCLTQETYLQG